MSIEAIGLLVTVVGIVFGWVFSWAKSQAETNRRSIEKLHSRVDEAEGKADAAIDMIRVHLVRHEERERKE